MMLPNVFVLPRTSFAVIIEFCNLITIQSKPTTFVFVNQTFKMSSATATAFDVAEYKPVLLDMDCLGRIGDTILPNAMAVCLDDSGKQEIMAHLSYLFTAGMMFLYYYNETGSDYKNGSPCARFYKARIRVDLALIQEEAQRTATRDPFVPITADKFRSFLQHFGIMMLQACTEDITANAQKGLGNLRVFFDYMTNRLFQAVRTCEDEFDVVEWSTIYLNDPENAVRQLEAARAVEDAQQKANFRKEMEAFEARKARPLSEKIDEAMADAIADIKANYAGADPTIVHSYPIYLPYREGGQYCRYRYVDGVEYKFTVHY